LKSQVWDNAAKEVLDISLDLDQATEDFYNSITEKLSDKVDNNEITEDEYKKLIGELDNLKEKDILKEDLMGRIDVTMEDEGNDTDELIDKDIPESKPEDEMVLPDVPKDTMSPVQQQIDTTPGLQEI